MISLHPTLLRRYYEIARLLIRYGGKELLSDDAIGELSQGIDEEERNAGDELAKDLEELGPTFVKLGQLLSTRPDLVPPAYADSLKRLQSDVEPFPFEQAEEILTEELGARPSKAFREFDEKPFAAASLSQVHRAVLRDGRQVVVKIQRPGIRRRVADDIEALDELAKFIERHNEAARRHQLSDVVAQFARTLKNELDFRHEVANLETFRQNLAEFELLVVPQPIPDFCSSRLLTMMYIDGTQISELNPVVRTDLDGESLADELFRAYLHQVLVDGFFHADPHPGNILLTRDHRLAILDLGMVGRFQRDTQTRLLKLLIAVGHGEAGRCTEAALELGEVMDDFDQAEFRRRVSDLVGQTQNAALEDIQVGRVVLELCAIAADCGIRIPAELSVLGKTLLNLDEIGRCLDPDFDPQAAVRRHAAEITTLRLDRETGISRIVGVLLESKELIERLPGRLNAIIETVAANKLRLEVDAIDEEALIVAIQNVANRITAGLVLAALIVGAALLMRIETQFTLMGYPGLAIVLFLAAAAGGFFLVWSILFGSDPKTKVE